MEVSHTNTNCCIRFYDVCFIVYVILLSMQNNKMFMCSLYHGIIHRFSSFPTLYYLTCFCNTIENVNTNTETSKYPLISNKTVSTHLYFFLHFNTGYLNLLVSKIQLSGTRKFTLR